MAADKKQFESFLRTLVPLNRLTSADRDKVINQADIVKHKKNQYVFKQGEKDNFSFYLLEGELEMSADGQLVREVVGGSDAAKYPLAQLQPRQLSAKAKSAITVFVIDRALVDKLASLETKGIAGTDVEVSEIEADEDADWMTRMLQSELFSRLPAKNIQQVFTLMEAVPVEKGAVIINQGDPGDYYYTIQKGRCAVTRKTSAAGKTVTLAELHEGDAFGEEALVADVARNATVTMLTNGELMRLPKDDFIELIKKPIEVSVTYAEAQGMVKEGAVWLDVRFPDEYKDSGIDGSTNMPLHFLRMQIDKLDQGKRYIVYCDTGDSSSVGAFLLIQRGFDACCLAGGLLHSPLKSTVKVQHVPARSAPPPEETKPKAELPEEQEGEVKAEPAEARDKGPSAEGNVQADAIQAELKESNEQLEAAVALKTEATNRVEEARKIKEEIEAARREVEEAGKKKELKQESIEKRLREEIKVRIGEERRKLEEKFEGSAKALEKAQREREAAEAARRAAMEDAAQQIAEHKAALDKKYADSDAKLHAERERREGEAKKIEESLEKARRAKEEAEAAWREAEEQAENLRAGGGKAKSVKKEAKVAQASKKLEEASRRQTEVEEAKKASEVELIKQQLEEEQLRKQLEQEVEGWRREQEQSQTTQFPPELLEKQREQMRRLKERTDVARVDAEEAVKDLLNDIASQLEDDN